MAKKKKFYVVWRGREVGIFNSWDKCKKQISGFTGAEYKSFKNKEEAEAAFEGNYWAVAGKDKGKSDLSPSEKAAYGTPNWNSIAVDAACSSSTNLMEYQGVDVKTNQVLFKQGPFYGGTNNIGEFLGIVHGLGYLKQKNISLPIYTDSRTAMKWVRDKKTKTTMIETQANTKLFDLIRRAEKWLRSNTYETEIIKWETKAWGEIPADFGRK